MSEETDAFAVKSGPLAKTNFKDEQERLDEFAAAMSVSTQAGESIKGEQGEQGPQGEPGGVESTEKIDLFAGSLGATASKNAETAIIRIVKVGGTPLAFGVDNASIGVVQGAQISFAFSGSWTSIPANNEYQCWVHYLNPAT